MAGRALIVALALLGGGCAVLPAPQPAAWGSAPRFAAPSAAAPSPTQPSSSAIPTGRPVAREDARFDPNAPERFTCIDGARLEVRYSQDRRIAQVGLNGGALVALRRIEQEAHLSYGSDGVQFLRFGPRVVYKSRSTSVVVRRGDTLGDIALRLYGDRARAQEIARINADEIANADLIRPGQVLRLSEVEKRCRRTLT